MSFPTSNESEMRGMNSSGLASNYATVREVLDHGRDLFSMPSMESNGMNPSANMPMAQAANSFASQRMYNSNGSHYPYGNSSQMFGGQQPVSSQFQQQNMPSTYQSNGSMNMPNSYYHGHQQQQNAYSNTAQAQGHGHHNPGPSHPQATHQGFYSGMPLNGRLPNGIYATSSNNGNQFNSQGYNTPPPSQPWQEASQQKPGKENDDKKEKICGACHKLYKWPHILDCLHNYCFHCCLKGYDIVNKSITCPQCNNVTKIPKGPCSLKMDYEMVCELLKEVSFSPLTCTACTRDQEAVSCCFACNAYLCSECYDRHKHMLQFQDHQLKPIAKIGMHNGEYKPLCEKHYPNPQESYCVHCDELICVECEPNHNHPTANGSGNNFNLREAFNIVAARLQTWNEDAYIKFNDVLDIIKKVPEMQQLIDQKKRNMKRSIEEFSDYLKNVVEQCRTSAMDEVDAAHVQMDAKVQSLVKTYRDLATGLEGMAKFNSRTLEHGKMTHVMKNLTVMESAYKRLIAMYADTMNGSDAIRIDFKFNPNFPSVSEIIYENFHNITYKVNEVEHKVIPNSQTSRSDSRLRGFLEYNNTNESSDCNYQRWSSASETMSISTWNSSNDRDRKSGTFIPNINRCRTRTSYVHVFGEYGRGDYAFTEPSGQAYLKDGSYVICDTNNHRIVYYSAQHEFIRSIGQPPNLPPLAEDQDHRNGGLRNKGFTRQDGYLYFPNRVAICPITQNIVATERPPSHDIQIFTVDGEFKRCFGGNILQHPRGVTVDEHGRIIVVECKVMKLVMFDQEGNFIVSHSLTKDLEFPNDVAAKDDRIYISDNRGHCVQVFSYEAEFIQKIGFESVTYFPIGVSINFQNQLVVTDNHNTFNITVFDLCGNVLHIFESITKHAQCHNVAVHPSSLELMLTTKDCNVYFFNYDPNAQHPPPTSGVPRAIGHPFNNRRGRGNSNGNGNNTYY